MMNRLPDYLEHMRQSHCRYAVVLGHGANYSYRTSELSEAVVMSLIVLGEAATKVMDQHMTFAEHK
jgi:uncharacterized protein with HEPN domain